MIMNAGEDDDLDRGCVLGVRAYGLRSQTAKIFLQTYGGGKVSFTINAVGQVYKQTVEFVYLSGAISTDR